MWSTFSPLRSRTKRSMIVDGEMRTEANGTSPRRHSSSRTGSSPTRSRHHVTDFSTSETLNTTWSMPVTRMPVTLPIGPARRVVARADDRALGADADQRAVAPPEPDPPAADRPVQAFGLDVQQDPVLGGLVEDDPHGVVEAGAARLTAR